MIINVWTSPRTGSNWFCKKLAHDFKAYSISEMFNLNLYSYYNTEINNSIYFMKDYQEGFYFTEYSVVNGKIIEQKIYGQRVKDNSEEELYRISLLDKITQTVILSNHASPISEAAYRKLMQIGNKNYYLYRENLEALMESYAICYATKTFIQYGNSKDIETEIDINVKVYENLADRIIAWCNLDMTDGEIVRYEDLDFNEYIDEDNMPVKQYNNKVITISESNKKIIKKLCEKIRNHAT